MFTKVVFMALQFTTLALAQNFTGGYKLTQLSTNTMSTVLTGVDQVIAGGYIPLEHGQKNYQWLVFFKNTDLLQVGMGIS